MLARHFGVDEHQAMRVYPAWYVDVLLDGLRIEQGDVPASQQPVVGEDDWDAPLPEWAKAWADAPEAEPNRAGRD